MAINPVPFNRSVLGVADDFGEALVEDLKFQLANLDKFATGDLIETMYYEVKEADGKAVIKVFARDYFRYVERGRRPGAKMPPEEPIRKWLRVKLMPERLQFVVRRSIARKGIKGVFILNPTIKKITADFLPKYSKQLSNLVGVTLINDVYSQTNTRGQIIPKSLR